MSLFIIQDETPFDNNTTTDNSSEYCGKKWSEFWNNYTLIDHYVTMTVSIVGLLTNILNMTVFTRTKMWTPTNSILAALALSDFLCCLRSLVSRTIQLDVERRREWRGPGRVAVEGLIDWVFFQLFHMWSIYLTLTMALWRFLAVVYPLKNRAWCTWKWTMRSIFGVFLLSLLIIPPMFVGVRPMILKNRTDGQHDFVYWYKEYTLGSTVFLWTHGLLIKILPSLAMTILSIQMVWTLTKAHRIRRTLIHIPEVKGTEVTKENARKVSNQSGKLEKSSRTTKMLFAILIIFLVTEFPYGILSLVDTMVASEEFYEECYDPLIPFLNVNEFFSSSISFFVYVVMSRKFRETLLENGRRISHWVRGHVIKFGLYKFSEK